MIMYFFKTKPFFDTKYIVCGSAGGVTVIGAENRNSMKSSNQTESIALTLQSCPWKML